MKSHLVVLCLITNFCFGQDSDILAKFNTLNNQLHHKPINYIKSLELLESNDSSFINSPSIHSFYLQTKATFLSFIGKHKEAKKIYLESKSSIKNIDLKSQYVSNSIIKNICESAKKTQLVVINENHIYPEHRVFTTSLLSDLYNEGYRYLALEDLSITRVDTLNITNQPKSNYGVYINEVMYANMVRRAIELGYTLVAYDENDFFEIHKRDSVAANELKKVFDKDSNAKVIVHCGLEHLSEHKKRLAHYLRTGLNIDPLTINQVNYTNDKQSAFNCPYQIYPIDDNIKTNYTFKADFQILHPDYSGKERPSYLFRNNRIEHNLDLTSIKVKLPYIIEIKKITDEDDTIPLDRLLIDVPTNNISVSTLKSDTTLIIKNKKAEIVYRKNIN